MAENEIVQALAQILDELPEGKRTVMLAWASKEMRERPIITQCSTVMWDDGDPGCVHPYGEGGTSLCTCAPQKAPADPPREPRPGAWMTVVWHVGKPCPSQPSAMIFAIVGDDGPGAQGPQSKVVVWSVGQGEVDGKPEKAFFRETIYNPQHTFGPLTKEALYRDWFDFFATEEQREADGDAGEPERPQLNGGA